MKNTMEQNFLKKYNLKDFRNLGKSVAMKIEADLSQMSEIAREKVIEKFPDLANLGKSIVTDGKDVTIESIKKEADVATAYIDLCSENSKTYEERMKSGELSPEQEKAYSDNIMELNKRAQECSHDSSQQMNQHSDSFEKYGILVLALCVSVLGVSIKAVRSASK